MKNIYTKYFSKIEAFFKAMLLLILLGSGVKVRGQGTENFSNIAATGTYGTRTWAGTNGQVWNATDAREDQTITGKAITIKNGDLNFGLTAAQLSAGIGSLTLNAKAPFGSPDVGVLNLFVNGSSVGTKSTSGATTSTIVSYTWSNINISTLTTLSISQTAAGSRITIDDISWTASCIGPSNPVSPTVTGTNPSCGATSLNTIVPPGGETYYWQGITALGTSTSNPTSATFPISVSGTFYVRSQNASGCWSAGSGSLVVTINNPVNITTQPITTTQSVCLGGAISSLNVIALGTTPTYQWYSNNVPSNSGGTLIASATSTTYAPSNTLLGTTYYYCVLLGAAPCTSVISNVSGGITVNALPANPVGTISGTTPSCGSTLLNYSNPTATEYWQNSASGTSTANPTTTGLTVATTGNYFVRVFNGTCWSASSTGAFAVTINTNPIISIQPTNQTVSTPTAATFSITAANAASYQWQVNTGSGFVNVSTGTGGSTASYTTAATNSGMDGYVYKCIINGTAQCGSITSVSATLTVSTGPCLNEGFAAGTSAPTGWVFTSIGGTYTSASNYGLSLPSLQFDATNDRVQTPSLTSPSDLSFWIKGQVTNATSALLVEGFNGSTWVTIQNITPLPTTGTIYTYNGSTTPALPAALTQFRFTYAKSAGNLALDDVKVFCNAACPTSTTIIALKPATGPINTRVTITGTGFTNTSVVKFGSITAVSIYKNATTIEAIVPAGVATVTDIIVSNAFGCYSIPFTGFTLITTSGSCGISDLIISEIYDPSSGNNHYIEIYNGTLNVINLDGPDYELSVVNNPGNNITTWNISGTIAPGQVIVYYAGGNGGLANGTQANNGVGYNDGFDEIRLLKNGVILDRVIAPDEIGFTIKRNTNITAPNATYTAAEWTILSTESTADITYYNVVAPIYVAANPVDQACTFSMNITALGTPTAYQWKFFNTTTNTWDYVSANGANSNLAPAFVAGSTSSTFTITGDISALYKVQFYCELAKAGCTNVSYAAEFSYSTKAYYKSNIALGNWTAPASWLMSDDNITYVPTCSYPIAKNSDQVIIQNGHKITFAINSLLLEESKVTIENGGEFELGTSAQIRFLNRQAGADFLVNGLFTDRSSSGNGIYFEVGATWNVALNATIVKTNSASVNAYQSAYEGGINTIPATANWIFRYNGDGVIAVTTTQMFYPNLTFESVSGFHNANGITEKFLGSVGGFATVKGNLDVGGTQGLGTYTLYNENTNAQAMLLNGNLTIRSGSTLNNGASVSGTGFELKGNITADGTFNVNTNANGLLILSGSTAQTISGSNAVANNMNVQNCTITNTVGITQNKDFNIFGTNTFGVNSKLDFGTGIISFKSNAIQTANVAAFPTSASIIYTGQGRFSIERYLRPFKAWRFLATPFQLDATTKVKSEWQEAGNATVGYGTQITGPGGAVTGMDDISQRASMKSYDMFSDNFINVTNTNTANIINKEGYFIFVRGDRTVGYGGTTGSTTLRIKGKILTGDQPYTVVANKFLSIGNPYPSQIDFKQVAIPTGVEGSYTVWNANPVGTLYNAGKYEQRVKSIITGDYEYLGTAQNNIESGQGFLIQGSIGGGGTIILKETNKTAGSTLASKGGVQSRAGIIFPTLEINLFAKEVDGSFIKAGTAFINFDVGFNIGLDNMDVRKVMNASDNISIKKLNNILIAERTKPLEVSDTILLHLSDTREAAYQFLIDPSALGNIGLEAYLQDKFLQTSTPVSLLDSTLIHFNITNNAASKAVDRFMIVFKQTATTSFIAISSKRNIDKTITINWNVANEKNVSNYVVEQSNDGINFTALPSIITPISNTAGSVTYTKIDVASKAANWYRVKINNSNNSVKYSAIAMVAAIKEDAENNTPIVSIEPNIVLNGSINLRFQNKELGKYFVHVYNAIGQKIKEITVQLLKNNKSFVINVGEIAKGKYFLQLKNIKGDKTLVDFIVN